MKAMDPEMLSFREVVGAGAGPSRYGVNLKNSHGDGCQRIFPERT